MSRKPEQSRSRGNCDVEIVESGDGSHTLRLPERKEHYHSTHGALAESHHVFIESGLEVAQHAEEGSPLRLLEVGFGTGLNALLTALWASDRDVEIFYATLEPHPLPVEIVSRLNYPDLISGAHTEACFEKLHRCPWNETVSISDTFALRKIECTLEEFSCNSPFDLVYYDAFGPRAQPELWNAAIWAKLLALMRPSALMVTYCAKGQVKRDLKDAGFQIETLPGPPRKREMIRATASTNF